jgi:hypothetical protein
MGRFYTYLNDQNFMPFFDLMRLSIQVDLNLPESLYVFLLDYIFDYCLVNCSSQFVWTHEEKEKPFEQLTLLFADVRTEACS